MLNFHCVVEGGNGRWFVNMYRGPVYCMAPVLGKNRMKLWRDSWDNSVIIGKA